MLCIKKNNITRCFIECVLYQRELCVNLGIRNCAADLNELKANEYNWEARTKCAISEWECSPYPSRSTLSRKYFFNGNAITWVHPRSTSSPLAVTFGQVRATVSNSQRPRGNPTPHGDLECLPTHVCTSTICDSVLARIALLDKPGRLLETSLVDLTRRPRPLMLASYFRLNSFS